MTTSKVFWITGLSGCGKTTFAKKLVKELNSEGKNTILIDGDVIREIFDNEIDYSRQARLKTAYQYSKLAKFLSRNGLDVICSTISLFNEVQKWNRENIPGYVEIFIKVEKDELIRRDSKKIYSRAMSGELRNVVGVDIEAEFPKNPDLILDNVTENNLDFYVKKAAKIASDQVS